MSEAMWRICALDIAGGGGVATVTLRSGVQLGGSVDVQQSTGGTLHLVTARGWHTIEYGEIAAITGEAR